jgi:hypothetical protein
MLRIVEQGGTRLRVGTLRKARPRRLLSKSESVYKVLQSFSRHVILNNILIIRGVNYGLQNYP